MKPHLLLIKFIGVIVPSRLRANWRQEWEAELRNREQLLAEWDKLNWQTRLDLLRRSIGAFWDALLLQPRRMEDELFQDLRYGIRILLKSPGFTLTAVLTLALGIGANTAMFSILDAWLIRPLPFKDSERIVIVLRNNLNRPAEPAFFPLYRDVESWKRESKSFESLSGIFWRRFLLTGGGEPEELAGMITTRDLFTTLGVPALRGRTFRQDDPAGPQVTVISHQLWQRRFGGSEEAIGLSLTLNGVAHQIIGVMPQDFDLRMLDQSTGAVLWTPLPASEPGYRPDSTGPLAAIGRLNPGVTPTAAQSEISIIQKRIDAGYPDNPRMSGPLVTRLQADNSRSIRSTLFSLSAAAGLVLLIACTNLAGLLLARAARRRGEMAIRAALGSGRRRLVAQLLTENLLLSLLGAAGGLLLGYAGIRLFVALNPLGVLPSNAIALDLRTLGFTLGLTLLTTLLFGLAPALRISRVDLNSILKSGGRGTSVGSPGRHILSAMVTAQLALTVVLLIGAGLMIKTLIRVRTETLGFSAENVAVAKLVLPVEIALQTDRRNYLYDRLLEKVLSMPGAQSAAITSAWPLIGGPNTTCVISSIDGEDQPVPDGAIPCGGPIVTPDYFSTLSIPLLRGRTFSTQDHERSEQVVIIDELIARSVFPNRDPVGRRIRTSTNSPWRTIIGVVGTTRSTSIIHSLAWRDSPQLFIPHRQSQENRFGPVGNSVWTYIRSTHQPAISEFRQLVSSVDKDVAVAEFRPMDEVVANFTRQPLLRTSLLGAFAVMALLLAALGIYGVVSQSVAQRTHEIGIRMALGARPRDVLVIVVRQGMTLTFIGVAGGLMGSFALARLFSNLLYGVSATDPATFAMIPVLLAGVALVAAVIPARRAMRVNPMAALRDE